MFYTILLYIYWIVVTSHLLYRDIVVRISCVCLIIILYFMYIHKSLYKM